MLTRAADRSRRLAARLRAPLRDRSGVTAIEYALIAGVLAIAIVAALPTLGAALQTLFSTAAARFGAATF